MNRSIVSCAAVAAFAIVVSGTRPHAQTASRHAAGRRDGAEIPFDAAGLLDIRPT
jgi:hypothetical protein